MTSLNGRGATTVEMELASLERRLAEMAGQLEAERAGAAEVEAALLTGRAHVGDVTAARQRCAVLQDAVGALQGQIDIKVGEWSARERADEVGRTLTEIGERTRALEARCAALHDEGVEGLRRIAGLMAEENEAYRLERHALAGMVARLRELRAGDADSGGAGEAEVELPSVRMFWPRMGAVGDPLSAAVRKAFEGAVRGRA